MPISLPDRYVGGPFAEQLNPEDPRFPLLLKERLDGIQQNFEAISAQPAPTAEGGAGADVTINATASTLGPAESATVVVTEPTSNLFNFAFGMPQGVKGDTGSQGPAGATGPAGPAGAQGPQGVAGTPGETWFTGSGAPADATGIVGDWYLDSVNGDYYEKTGASTWTLRGNLEGPQGAVGPAGPQGPPGAANASYSGIWRWTTSTVDAAASGDVGINAASAASATQVHLNEQKRDGTDVSSRFPAVEVGDDIYLQQATDATRWARFDIIGAPTDHGTWWSWPVAFLEGSTAGSPGQNTDVQVSFLVEGTQIEEWLSGAGAPAGTLGKIGDWYLNTSNGDVYEKTADTTWTLRANITGPQGIQGIQGPEGPEGDPGAMDVYEQPGDPGAPPAVVGSIWIDTDAPDPAPVSAAPPRVTSLPSSPVEGQECVYVADAANGVLWHLRYNAAAASPYKWEFVGGSPLYVEHTAAEFQGSGGQFLDLSGPSLAIPLAGDYDLIARARAAYPAAVAFIWATRIVNAAVTVEYVGATVAGPPGGGATISQEMERTRRFAGMPVGTIKQQYYVEGSGANFDERAIIARPVRVG
jgi:hypothetical protein